MSEYIIDDDMIIAEAVREKIVRCRDCKHFMDKTNECNLQDEWNEMHWLDVEPDGFCAWAKRREEQ